MNRKLLSDYLKSVGVIKSKPIYEAFEAIDRASFVLDSHTTLAYEDTALPIGYGATISQPYTVALMIELLEPKREHNILDIGSGSAWTTALLARIIGPKGHVYGVELIPELVKLGQNNLRKLKVNNAEILQAEPRVLGLPDKAPFDRILVSAAGEEISPGLIAQLKSPGILVLPVHNSIIKVIKSPDGIVTAEEYPGFVFVPLVT
jgi:protein-L-isoaspartate(D-aspartate) O-methyltransferase